MELIAIKQLTYAARVYHPGDHFHVDEKWHGDLLKAHGQAIEPPGEKTTKRKYQRRDMRVIDE
jgi:hypothetical protein